MPTSPVRSSRISCVRRGRRHRSRRLSHGGGRITSRRRRDRTSIGCCSSDRIDAVTFTSPSAVRAFATIFGEDQAADLLAHTVVASIGPVTSQAARRLGLHVAVEPAVHSGAGIDRSADGAFRGRRSDGREPADVERGSHDFMESIANRHGHVHHDSFAADAAAAPAPAHRGRSGRSSARRDSRPTASSTRCSCCDGEGVRREVELDAGRVPAVRGRSRARKRPPRRRTACRRSCCSGCRNRRTTSARSPRIRRRRCSRRSARSSARCPTCW